MIRLAIVMVFTAVLASCQTSAPPTSPTGLPSPTPASQPQARVVFEGAYTLTFIADETCVLLPRDVRSRAYTAAVTHDRPQDFGTLFTAQLGGASFYPQYIVLETSRVHIKQSHPRSNPPVARVPELFSSRRRDD